MASYPNAVATFRTMVNRIGVVYNALRTKDIYAEDFNNERAEIVAIETILGLNPEGAFDTVVERLEDIESQLGGVTSLLERIGPASESGRYDMGGWLTDSVATASITKDRAIGVPFYVAKTTSYDKVVVKIGTKSSTSGAVCRLGVYANDAGKPGDLLADAGTFNINSTNGVIELTIDLTLDAGLYFICMVTNGTGATAYKMSSATDGVQSLPPISVSASTFSGASQAGLFVKESVGSWATNGLPDPASFDSTMYNLTSSFAFALRIV